MKEQFGGLIFENITSIRNNLSNILQKILQGKPSSFGTGLQIMCPHSRMKLQITQELINNLANIPQKIALLQNKIPLFSIDTIYQYMRSLIATNITNMSVLKNSQAPTPLEQEYRRIIKIYESLKKIVSNIQIMGQGPWAPSTFPITDEDFSEFPIDADADFSNLYLQELKRYLNNIIEKCKIFFKTFKKELDIVLKNKKNIEKIIEDYQHLVTSIEKDPAGVADPAGVVNSLREAIYTSQAINKANLENMKTIQSGFTTLRSNLYDELDRINSAIIIKANEDISSLMKTPNPTRSERKIIAVYTSTMEQLSDDTDAAIKLVLQKIPNFKKYNVNRTSRQEFEYLVMLKKYIKKIEKIAKFIGEPEP